MNKKYYYPLTVVVLLLMFLWNYCKNNPNDDKEYCDKFEKVKEDVIFNNIYRDSLGFIPVKSSDYLEKRLNNWFVEFYLKNKKKYGLLKIEYNCLNSIQKDIYFLRNGSKLKIYFKKDEVLDFNTSLIDKDEIIHYPTIEEAYALLKADNLVKRKTSFFISNEPSLFDNNNCKEKFYVFFEKFIKDNDYQKQHIRYPLKITVINNSHKDSIKHILIDSLNLKNLNLKNEIKNKRDKNDSYIREIDQSINCIFFYKKYTIDSDEKEIYKFLKINDTWFLTEVFKTR